MVSAERKAVVGSPDLETLTTSHIERVFPFVKVTVAKTNSDYEAEKQVVLAHVRTAAQYRQTEEPKETKRRQISYAENFRYDRRIPWTH